ncbi:MAG TPA: flagellar biosynthesis protein FlgA [Firmicutes bacterium]|jgi:flagellar P-ring protein FlgI|nr:flagellar biosynthesis protein FlgA [Bacillota bacterium]
MWLKNSPKIITGVVLIMISLTLFSTAVFGDTLSSSTRIKDIAKLQGVRNNQLTGMGIIVGLNGTGDSSRANSQMVVNMLAKWGIIVTMADLKIKNVAAVMITASLPPYLHIGESLDVQVASLGDAKSLQGGTLLQAPLNGSDGKVYAMAQGTVYIGSPSPAGTGGNQRNNSGTVGVISQGAIVERDAPMQFDLTGKLRWSLYNPDFTTASRLAQSINENIAPGVAKAIDMGSVEVMVPRDKFADPIGFISEVENLSVTPDGIAKVIINERDGTVVIGDKVKIAPVAVTCRNINVRINPPATGAANSDNNGGNAPDPYAAYGNSGRVLDLPDGTTIGSIVRALNAVGTTPQDVIAVIVAIKEAGALYGTLEFQ